MYVAYVCWYDAALGVTTLLLCHCSQAKLAEDLRRAQEEEAARQAALAEKRKCDLCHAQPTRCDCFWPCLNG